MITPIPFLNKLAKAFVENILEATSFSLFPCLLELALPGQSQFNIGFAYPHVRQDVRPWLAMADSFEAPFREPGRTRKS